MHEHSPAPWKPIYSTDYIYEPDEDDLANRRLYRIEDANGRTVYYTESGYFEPNPADVPLITAAPDMLQALRHIIRHNNTLKPAYRLPDSLIREIQTTIAKATGCPQTAPGLADDV